MRTANFCGASWSEDAELTQRTPSQQKIGDYFAACMNTTAIDALGVKPLQPELDRIAALKDRGELAAFLRQGAERRGMYFFEAGSSQDPKNAESMIVEMAAGGLGLPDSRLLHQERREERGDPCPLCRLPWRNYWFWLEIRRRKPRPKRWPP